MFDSAEKPFEQQCVEYQTRQPDEHQRQIVVHFRYGEDCTYVDDGGYERSYYGQCNQRREYLRPTFYVVAAHGYLANPDDSDSQHRKQYEKVHRLSGESDYAELFHPQYARDVREQNEIDDVCRQCQDYIVYEITLYVHLPLLALIFG